MTRPKPLARQPKARRVQDARAVAHVDPASCPGPPRCRDPMENGYPCCRESWAPTDLTKWSMSTQQQAVAHLRGGSKLSICGACWTNLTHNCWHNTLPSYMATNNRQSRLSTRRCESASCIAHCPLQSQSSRQSIAFTSASISSVNLPTAIENLRPVFGSCESRRLGTCE